MAKNISAGRTSCVPTSFGWNFHVKGSSYWVDWQRFFPNRATLRQSAYLSTFGKESFNKGSRDERDSDKLDVFGYSSSLWVWAARYFAPSCIFRNQRQPTLVIIHACVTFLPLNQSPQMGQDRNNFARMHASSSVKKRDSLRDRGSLPLCLERRHAQCLYVDGKNCEGRGLAFLKRNAMRKAHSPGSLMDATL